ncbi:MAG: NAD kinase [Saprospiraceae bacterium]
MRALIFGRSVADNNQEYVQEVVDTFSKAGFELFFFKPFFDQLPKLKFAAEGHLVDERILKKNEFDFVIALGGDGTILNAITLVQDSEIPMLGINLGRLGFLAGFEKKEISLAAFQIKSGAYILESRTMLQLDSNLPLFGNSKFALNDFTLLKTDHSSMIVIHTYIDGSFLNSYWADGLIVATPTGSTGYNLSCGGPIIFPGSGNFVITPVAPHNLNVRPLVLADKSVISFEVEGRSENFLCTLDSRFETVTPAHKISIRKCDFNVNLVKPLGMNFLKTLRGKFAWGSDTRNLY